MASVVSVRLFLCVIININLHEDVTCALVIFARNILGIHHAHANLVVKDGLWCDIPDFLFFCLLLFVLGFDFQPASNNSLGQGCALVVELSVLNWFFIESLPISREESIVQVDYGFSNQVISKQVVVVISFDDKWRSAWKVSFKFEILVELGVRFIQLVVITIAFNVITKGHDKVRVTEGTNVSLSEVIAF